MSTPVKVVLIALLIIILLVGAVLIYANHMLGKISRDEFAGDSSLNIADLLAGEELTGAEDSTEALENIWQAYEEIKDQPLLEEGDHIVNYLLIDRKSVV